MSLLVFDPITYAIIEMVKKAVSKTEDATKNGDISVLQAEEVRQEVSLRMAERQAKVAQEVAIARRIELAEKVEIEEFYDVRGEAGAGLKTDGESASLGVQGKGKRVVRRVYRFKGTVEQIESQNTTPE